MTRNELKDALRPFVEPKVSKEQCDHLAIIMRDWIASNADRPVGEVFDEWNTVMYELLMEETVEPTSHIKH